MLALSGCSVGYTAPQAASTPRPTLSTSGTPSGPTVPGYTYGEIPPIPLFTIPSLAVADAALGGFTVDLGQKVPATPGITVSPAVCGDAVVRAKGESSLVLNGDGSGVVTGPDGSTVNNGDGSGTHSDAHSSIVVNGDGSGTYTNDSGISIVNNGDGSGTYTSPTLSVVVNGDGSGTRNDSAVGTSLVNNGDGSGTYNDKSQSIVNNGDGSGTYSGHGLSIVNSGDGTGLVNGVRMKLKPLPKVLPAGKFPAMGTIQPIKYCGTTITLQDGVLFDFDKSDVRPDAAAVLDKLATVLIELKVPAAEIGGHTDSIGTKDYNQALSERRAQSVVTALKQRGVRMRMEAVGYGESAPVAANEIDGHDNPAGRQLNRRVEIYIPAF